MARLLKGNRVIDVQDELAASYLAEGYDQIDVNGNIIKKATGGRMIPLAEYNKLYDKVNDLQEENKVLLSENDRLSKQLRSQQNNNKR